MARPPLPPITLDQDDPLRGKEATDAANTYAVLSAAYDNDRDAANQLIGQVMTANAYTNFSKTVMTSALAFFKKNKYYRNCRGQILGQSGKLDGTWENFCVVALGRSVAQVDEDIANLDAFGAETLDSLQALGVGYRELRTYRRLPEDDRTALAEAAKQDSKEAFLDLAESLIERHAKEKEALRADNEAKDARLATVTQKRDAQAARIDELETKLKSAQRLTAEAAPDDVLAALQQDIAVAAIQCEQILCGQATRALDALDKHCEIWGRFPALHGALLQIESSIERVLGQVAHLRDKYGIQEVDKRLIPAWDKQASTDAE